MQPIEIIVIVLSIAFVIGVGIWMVIRKKQGKSACGCSDCDGNCAKCREKIEKAREEIRKNKENE
ncbi:MAG: hypothetical protein K2P12_03785 [Clostridia bacterium]|nr:hypothetical protein [Clostridia bacterium]